MGTLAFERGVSTLGQQMLFQRELRGDHRGGAAQRHARTIPLIRQRIADAWMGLEIQRYNALRVLSSDEPSSRPSAADHQDLLGDLAPRARRARDGRARPRGRGGARGPYELTALQRLFLFTRSDTIYGGSNEIQRNLIAERALGLPRDPPAPMKQSACPTRRGTACWPARPSW